MLKPTVRVVLLAGAGALAAACGGSPASTAAPTASLSTVPPLPSIQIPSFAPATELEGLFPEEIGGNRLSVSSARGEDVVTRFATDQPDRFRQTIADLGATVDQISAAISFNLWPGATETDLTGLAMTALRVDGVPAASTLAALQGYVEEDVPNAQVSQQTVGGKGVTVISDPADPEGTFYLYAYNDVVFLIGGTAQHVEEALTKLP